MAKTIARVISMNHLMQCVEFFYLQKPCGQHVSRTTRRNNILLELFRVGFIYLSQEHFCHTVQEQSVMEKKRKDREV